MVMIKKLAAKFNSKYSEFKGNEGIQKAFMELDEYMKKRKKSDEAVTETKNIDLNKFGEVVPSPYKPIRLTSDKSYGSPVFTQEYTPAIPRGHYGHYGYEVLEMLAVKHGFEVSVDRSFSGRILLQKKTPKQIHKWVIDTAHFNSLSWGGITKMVEDWLFKISASDATWPQEYGAKPEVKLPKEWQVNE